ncbi:GNS1/SUR4 membrane protein [Pisolithus croceorrhizus]|nr:GNS1/SUR4 membrane protein [Pisolithus croceorrhizus]
MVSLADLLLTVLPTDTVPPYLKRWIVGESPLSTWPAVTTALTVYLATIFGIQELMRNGPPRKLNALFRCHNAFLTIGSFLLLALIAEEVLSLYLASGFYSAICSESSWTSKLEFYYMVNYYFKYIELLDTVFLVLKKKPLSFLHVFHHSATALLCFTQLNGKTSISWVVISLNLFVHVIMYYYYYATAGGAKIWWKRYLTTMQIVQFVIDLSIVYFGTYQRFAHSHCTWLPHIDNCAGTETAALFGCGLLSSYLVLFINFYVQTYRKPASARKAAVKNNDEQRNGVANGYVFSLVCIQCSSSIRAKYN